MSFSVSLPSGTPVADVPAEFDRQIAAYPDSPGKDEAAKVRSDVLDLVTILTEGHETLSSGSISGSVSGSNASFSISLSFPTVSAEAPPTTNA